MISEATWQVTLAMPRAEAWQKLQDISLAHHYVPGIIDTRITTEQRSGVGASRNVYQRWGRYLQETVTEWTDGEGFRIRLHKGAKDSPFANAFFRYALTDAEGGKTLLTTTMGYSPPLGILGQWLDKWLLNRIITSVIRDVALSMKHYYETGVATTPADLKRIKASL